MEAIDCVDMATNRDSLCILWQSCDRTIKPSYGVFLYFACVFIYIHMCVCVYFNRYRYFFCRVMSLMSSHCRYCVAVVVFQL